MDVLVICLPGMYQITFCRMRFWVPQTKHYGMEDWTTNGWLTRSYEETGIFCLKFCDI